MSAGFYADDYWEGNDCYYPEDIITDCYGEYMRFLADNYWEGNDYDCPDDVPDYYGE